MSIENKDDTREKVYNWANKLSMLGDVIDISCSEQDGVVLNKYRTSSSDIKIPGFIDVVANGAFYNNDSLKTIEVEAGVKKLSIANKIGLDKLIIRNADVLDFSLVDTSVREVELYGESIIIHHRAFSNLQGFTTLSGNYKIIGVLQFGFASLNYSLLDELDLRWAGINKQGISNCYIKKLIISEHTRFDLNALNFSEIELLLMECYDKRSLDECRKTCNELMLENSVHTAKIEMIEGG